MKLLTPGVCLGLLAIAAAPATARKLPDKQSNAGDSISQGFDANSVPSDQVAEGWIQGSDSQVMSVYSRYAAKSSSFVQEPESVSGAEMVGGNDGFAAQASRICAQSTRPTFVSVLLGGNDVCNRAASSTGDAGANLYTVPTWTAALDAGLDQLASCLPDGSLVQVLSMPRVDFLYEAGTQKSFWCDWVIWPSAHICRVVTAESDAGRRAQIGARINQYNDATRNEIAAYNSNANGKNARGITFINDWQGSIEDGHPATSVGTVTFHSGDINGLDCFHPNIGGQHKIACAAWASSPDGDGSVTSCLQ